MKNIIFITVSLFSVPLLSSDSLCYLLITRVQKSALVRFLLCKKCYDDRSQETISSDISHINKQYPGLKAPSQKYQQSLTTLRSQQEYAFQDSTVQ
ncbi:MAG: hypothetical protein CL947_00890 [Epsilonproteobacteria bacterium]|nr:hypothetical protein [Campylobacterota bacterium]|tara:strand:- start:227 stop:514 length:288 start_codon:yes stop_codon:yes gene_type:complete